MTQTMYDSVAPANIPSDAQIVAGYDDGLYGPSDAAGWTPAAWSRFPNAAHVHITVTGATLSSLVADCENGDLTPQGAANWARDKIALQHSRPTIYCSTSLHGTVTTALEAVGLQFVRDVDWWEAHYDGLDVLSPGSVAKQYLGNIEINGKLVDVSVTNGIWPSPPAPQPVPTTEVPPMFITVQNDKQYLCSIGMNTNGSSKPVGVALWITDPETLDQLAPHYPTLTLSAEFWAEFVVNE